MTLGLNTVSSLWKRIPEFLKILGILGIGVGIFTFLLTHRSSNIDPNLIGVSLAIVVIIPLALLDIATSWSMYRIYASIVLSLGLILAATNVVTFFLLLSAVCFALAGYVIYFTIRFRKNNRSKPSVIFGILVSVMSIVMGLLFILGTISFKIIS